MSKPLETILVTGASSGIGLALSKKLLADGYAVIGVSRSGNAADIQHEQYSDIICDLSDIKQIEQQIKPFLGKDIPIAGVVFCAGQGYFGALEQLDFAKVEALIRLNLLSPMFLSKLLVPYFKRRKAGRLVFIGSEAALQGAKNGTAYCASKFGLRGFVQSLSAEARQAGVNVSLINPGMVDTPFFDDLHFEPGAHPSNSISVETLADCIITCLKTDSNSVIDEINLSPRNKVVSFK